MAHQRIWQEYYRRHRHSGKRGYLVIMEDDAICVDSPWCYSDFDGDGERTVTDLLWVLSEYGCTSGCTADLNGDGLVTVIDLMNLLSNYGVSCY